MASGLPGAWRPFGLTGQQVARHKPHVLANLSGDNLWQAVAEAQQEQLHVVREVEMRTKLPVLQQARRLRALLTRLRRSVSLVEAAVELERSRRAKAADDERRRREREARKMSEVTPTTLRQMAINDLREPGAARIVAARLYTEAHQRVKAPVMEAVKAEVPYAAIALLTGVSVGTVASWVAAAREEGEL
ncbi:hypothetical protein [Streptomyces luteireticuli]|uniref:Uncharacterized protein n=1 Tax=Streptomyces luteireticuli TaxID=173858 RepID=A0ABN0Y5U7_9ACTN